MKLILSKFENTKPEIVYEWKDTETEAEGWVVINSLRGGAAGGATRMRKGLDKHEVESMAKTRARNRFGEVKQELKAPVRLAASLRDVRPQTHRPLSGCR